MDVQQLFESQFEQMRKQDQAKYFLMQVAKVSLVKGSEDSFIALGVRVDNGQNVAVFSKKSTSGQHLPEKGGILRADKVARMPQKSKNDITAYSAEYFHAYRGDDFCLRAVAQAQRPKKDAQSNIWSADMRFFDVETGPVILDGNQIAEQIESELMRMLTPWKADEQSSITHDVKGSPLWGSGQEARPGMSPFVAVRSGAKTFYVYGDGAVRQKTNNENEFLYNLPTDTQIKAKVSKNTGLQNLLAVINNVKSQATPEQMAQLKITLIPGLQVRVGRESLGGKKQSYLAVPSAFDWKNNILLGDDGEPTVQPGFRLADAHIKISSRGAMMVVDAAPSAGGRLTQFIPETSVERTLRAGAEQENAQRTPTEAPSQARVATTQEPEPARQMREHEPSQYDAPAINQFDDAPMDDFGDFGQYAEDLALMQMPDQNFGTDDELDLLMEEASQRQNSRGNRPRM